MAQDEDHLTENNDCVNTMSELPGRPFSITMEVPLFLSILGLSLSATAISNIILFRTCVHSLHHSVDECNVFLVPEKNNDTQHLEVEVQKYATFVHMVKLVMESVGPAILSMFLGVWSDTHGRKPLIVWPLLGIAMSSMLTVIYSMSDSYGPWWYLLTAIPFSLSGGYAVLFTGAFCYVSDVSSTARRSFRMTVLECMVSAGGIIGALLSAYLLRAVGNVYLLLIVCTLNVIAYVFTNVYLVESLTGAIEGGITTMLDLLLIKEMIRECFKRRPNNLRAQLLLLTVANCLSIFILYGIANLDYLYTRKKLNWALKDFAMFSAISTAINIAGAVIGVTVLPISDLAFAMISFLTVAVEYTIKAFATTSWHMYLGSSIGVFGGLSSPLIRSLLSKILPLEDIAKVFALMAALEGICPLISPIVYNVVYEYTISVFPGAILLLTSFIRMTSFVMLGFVAYYRWRAQAPPYQSLPSEL